MPTPLPARPSLDWLRKRAKSTLHLIRNNRPGAKLAEAQLLVAREYGFASWRKLEAEVDSRLRIRAQEAPFSERLIADFLRAAGTGDRAALKASLRVHPGLVNAVGPHPFRGGGRPQALHVSIESNRRDIFDLLLKAGADINGRNDEYMEWSPLLAAIHGHAASMRRTLLNRGARIGLAEALSMGDGPTTMRLLKDGRRSLPRVVPNGGSLLMFARTAKAIDRLLELGVSLSLEDRWGATPMEAFSRLGPKGKPLLEHLATHGVVVDPPALARINDRRRLAAAIAEDPAIARQPAVLHAAVDFSRHALVEWLFLRGADPNVRDAGEAKRTPLHSAAWNGDLRMVKRLLMHGADPRLRDRQYDGTPAGWASTASEITNNPRCRDVAAYLGGLAHGPQSREG